MYRLAMKYVLRLGLLLVFVLAVSACTGVGASEVAQAKQRSPN